MRSKTKWIHPEHAKGVRSPQFDGASGPLTDKKIDQYILRGHYGEERQKALLETRKKKKKFVFEDVLKMLLNNEETR